MKWIVPLCLAGLSASCVTNQGRIEADREIGEPTDGRQLAIHFQSGFTSNHIDLQLDGRPVFTGVITTDNRIGLAHSMRFPIHQEKPTLEAFLILDNVKQQTFEIRLSKGLYVGFSKDLDDGKIRMEQSRSPFFYY